MTEHNRIETFKVAAAMDKYGGSFVQALGDAIRHADQRNLQRIKDAFPDYWEKYLTLANHPTT